MSARKLKVITDMEEVDRISDLPDSILGHVLSFLCTKSAVQTTILSKRWRNVWTSRHNLDFQFEPFEHSAEKVSSFSTFVDLVLSLRDCSNLHKFSFSARRLVDPSIVEKCIGYAVRHNVQELKIRAFCNRKPVEIPHAFFTCESLRVLKLTSVANPSIILPKTLALSALTTLHLKNFTFSDQNFNGEIFSSCPNLQTLILSKCSFGPKDSLKILSISVLQLRNLEILYWRSPMNCIVVSTPGLESFKYQGHISLVSFKDNLPFLDKVCIDLCCPSSCTAINVKLRKQKMAESLIRMFGELCNAKSVTLSLKTVKILSAVPDLQELEPIPFCNLKSLKFRAEDNCAKTAIPMNVMNYLLKSCPSVENMTIEIPMA